MQRELTFYPEIERARDLLYSEYTSQDRSIHVLLQDNSTSQHHFLLSAYREIVARYLSASLIQSPFAFLQDLVVRMDELARLTHVTPDDFKAMGFYVFLRSPDGYHLLASRDTDVFVHSARETLFLSEMPLPAVERFRVGDTAQVELFPHRLRDALFLLRLDPPCFRNRDVVLGCNEQDRGTVVTALSDPLWLSGGNRRTALKSAFLSRRVLVVRFDDTPAMVPRRRVVPAGGRRPVRVRWAFALGGATAILAVAGVVAWQVGLPAWRGGAARERPRPQRGMEAVRAVKSPSSSAPAPTLGPRLAENWHRTFGDAVTSSPVLHKDVVIFGCRDGNVYALDRESGETRWTVPLSRGVGASPVVHENRVIVADYGGAVVALSLDDGALAWRQELPERVVSSPSVLSDRIAFGCYDGYAYCLSLTDGKILWKTATGGVIRASAASTNGSFFVSSYDGYLYALSEVTGEVHWRYHLAGSVSSSPFAYRDLVVVGAPDGSLHAVDARNGSVRWKYKTQGAVKSAPVVDAGFVYAGSNDKNVYCLNATDGSMVWKYETSDIVLARPAVVAGVVYVGSYDGYLYCLDAKTGELLDRFHSDGEIYSSPLLDATAVYFGTNSGAFISLSHHAKKAL